MASPATLRRRAVGPQLLPFNALQDELVGQTLQQPESPKHDVVAKRASKLKARKKMLLPRSHKPREALLDVLIEKHKEKDIVQSDDFQGLVNLGFLILGAATLQLVVHSYKERGIVVDVALWRCMANDFFSAALLAVFLISFACSSFVLHLFIKKCWLSAKNAKPIYVATQILMYLVPVKVILDREMAPAVAGSIVVALLIITMKMHSYFSTNNMLAIQKTKAELRRNRSRERLHSSRGHLNGLNTNESLGTSSEERDDYVTDEESALLYPSNVSFGNFLYYLIAPTLVYEPSYPRAARIRYFYALKEFIACAVCMFIAFILFQQFLVPVLREDPAAWLLPYDIVRLSIPSIIMWLLGFYAYFHCFLNGMCELTRFADRRYYKDWWNASSLDLFWRKWNRPVHTWLLRHVYLESIHSAKVSKSAGTLITFFFSAIAHEFVFSTMFGVLRPWFFLGMAFQVPMIYLSRALVRALPERAGRRWGNLFVWCGLVIGQPVIEILYFREWFRRFPDGPCAIGL